MTTMHDRADTYLFLRQSGLSLEQVQALQERGVGLNEAVALSLKGLSFEEMLYLSTTQLPSNRTGPSLTPREKPVLDLVAEGFSNREIADRLGFSENTARAHVLTLMHKFDAHNRTRLAIRALRNGHGIPHDD